MEFNPSEDPSSDHIPPLPATSPFLSSTDDSSDSDIPDTPPSLTHDTPFTETTLSTQRSPAASGALRLDYSSLDHFSSDDSSSSSSSETSSDSSTYALSDSASSRSSSDHSLPASASGTRASHRLCSLVLSVHRSSAAIFERPSHDSSSVTLSFARADLLPSPKRFRSPELATDLEDSSAKSSEPSRSKGTDLEMDVDVERSDGIDIDPEIQAEIDECIAYADALRDRGIDVRVLVEAIDREEIEMGVRGPVEVRVNRVTHLVVADDIPKPAQEGAVEVTYETLGDLVQRFRDHTKEIPVRRVQLERDNRILKDMMDVASQRVARSVLTKRVTELERDNRRLRGTIPNTRSGASRTREAVNEQSDRRMAEALRVRDAIEEMEMEETEMEEMEMEEMEMEEMKMEEMEMVMGMEENMAITLEDLCLLEIFHISNCPEKYQVKFVHASEQNEIQKIESELWNLTVKARFQDAVRITNQLMDKKLEGYAARSVESKRRMESNSRNNRRQQPPFKRKNISGQNVVRAYTTGKNERRGYIGPHPLCNKCRNKYTHVGPCTVKSNNCKMVGTLTRDCTATIYPKHSRELSWKSSSGVVCYECGDRDILRRMPKLR
ncbi:hypothetical protein Tco_1310947 [Tanacetum coccineum]